MPVVAECTSVLIRNATLDASYPGGAVGFDKDCPISTYCTDGQISRVGFMDPTDASAYVNHLVKSGLPQNEIAIFQEGVGFASPCSWLLIAVAELGDGNEALMAWLRGTDGLEFVAPPGWQPGGTFMLTREEIERDYDLVSVKDGVEARRHRVTGQMIYQGRPRPPGAGGNSGSRSAEG